MGEQPHVTIIIPTRNRLERLKWCLQQIAVNTHYPNYDVVVIVDDDPQTAQWAGSLRQKGRWRVVVNEKQREWVACTIGGVSLAIDDYIVYFADDVEVERGWLTEAMKTMLSSFGDGVGLVSFQDGIQNENLAPHGLVSKRMAEYFGGDLFHPGYRHYYGDTELTAKAKALNRFAYSERARIKHVHPIVDKTVDDDVYRDSMGKCWQRDEYLFRARKERGFPVDDMIRSGRGNG